MTLFSNRVALRSLILIFSSALIAGLVIRPARAQDQANATLPAYRDTTLPLEKRVDDLVSRMTLDEKARQMQRTAPEITRLGVPSYDWWSEALHGVSRSGFATVFPQAI